MPLTTFLVNNYCSSHRPVLMFQPTVNCRASDSHSKQCQNVISWEKYAVTKCLCIYMYQCLWRGLGGGGGTSWLLNENLTFKGPEA